jgi:uncharacterized protein YqjF (DUF2071 family)
MSQDWRDLTFLHWAVDPERVRPLLPSGIEPDVLEGRTYVGLVPFTMLDAGPGRGHPVPWLGTFLETNVRLYSRDRLGRPGVVFRSLDSDRLAVVLGARTGFGTPYRWARMRHDVLPHPDGDRHHWASRVRWPREGGTGPRTRIDLVVGERRTPTALDVFLTARWALHTTVASRPLHIRNSHDPWPLHDARLLDLDDELVAAAGLPGLTDHPPDHVAFSPGVHTRFAFPRR